MAVRGNGVGMGDYPFREVKTARRVKSIIQEGGLVFFTSTEFEGNQNLICQKINLRLDSI